MGHPEHDIFEGRKQFQVERMILFSDAVFAIAITLLILEIKLPEVEIANLEEFKKMMGRLAPDFISFAFSFAVIGMFWTTHHRVFGYVSDFDGKMLWLNLHILFWIVVMPFTSRLNMAYGNLDIVWFIYSLNLAFVSFALLLFWGHIAKNKSLIHVSANKNILKYGRLRSLGTTIIFIVGGSLTFCPWVWVKWVSRFFFLLIFPLMAIIKRRYKASIHK